MRCDLWVSQNTKLQVRIFIETDDEGNATTLKPPYERLPNSYHGIYPTSYYATHTYVPPIKLPSSDPTKSPLLDSLGNKKLWIFKVIEYFILVFLFFTHFIFQYYNNNFQWYPVKSETRLRNFLENSHGWRRHLQ